MKHKPSKFLQLSAVVCVSVLTCAPAFAQSHGTTLGDYLGSHPQYQGEPGQQEPPSWQQQQRQPSWGEPVNRAGRPLQTSYAPPGYSPQSSGYYPPNSGYAPPNSGYAPPNSGYAPPNSGYAPPNSGYAPPNSGYAPPNSGYAPPNSGYAPPNSGYAPPNPNYSARYPGAPGPQQMPGNGGYGGYQPNYTNGGGTPYRRPGGPPMSPANNLQAERLAERVMSRVTGVPAGLYPGSGASSYNQLRSITNGLMRPPMNPLGALGGGMMGGGMMGGGLMGGGMMGGPSMSGLLRNFGF